MRRELRKQLTRLRRIQDDILRKKSTVEEPSLRIECIFDVYAYANVRCFKSNKHASYGLDTLSFTIREHPHMDEVDYEEMINQIKEFFKL
jgi:hypothetical protein